MQDESYGLRSKNNWRKEWGTSPWLSDDSLLLYRCVSGLFWLAFVIYDFARGEAFEIGSRYWTFLSHWVSFVTVLYFISACLTILWLRFVTTSYQLPCIGKLAWILLNILAGASMTVTVAWWSLLYRGGDIHFRSRVNHGVGSAWILLDIVLTYNPLYFKHIYQCALFSVAYVMMTIIYDYSLDKSESYVYRYINWSEDPVQALYMSFGIVFVITPLIYILQALIKPQLQMDQIEEVGKEDEVL